MKKPNIACPYCNSDEISKPKYSMKSFAISMLLFGFPLFFTKKIYHCFDCLSDFSKFDIQKSN